MIQANIYYVVTAAYSLEERITCPSAFIQFVRIHNYIFLQTVAPMQALFLLFVLNYFARVDYDNEIAEERHDSGLMSQSNNASWLNIS